jgi:predicted peptidase
MTKGIALSRRCEASSGRCAAELGPTRWPEKFAAAASIAGEGAPFEVQKPIFYWIFRDGTALADQSMWK